MLNRTLGGAAVTTFELRASDVSIVNTLTISASITSATACSNNATLTTVADRILCVLDGAYTAHLSARTLLSNEPCGFFIDTVFAKLYPEAFATESVCSGSSSTQRSSPIVTNNSTTGSFSGDSQSSSSDGSMARTKIIYIKIAVVVVLPVFVVWILVCRHTSISKSDLQLPLTTPRGKRTDHAEHHPVAPGIISAPPPSGYLVYDVRNDELLIAHRFPLGEITIIMQIASGGFGAVYLGTLTGR